MPNDMSSTGFAHSSRIMGTLRRALIWFPSRVPSPPQVQAFQVTLRLPKGASHTLQVAEDESVMDAIDAAGLDLPSLCRR